MLLGKNCMVHFTKASSNLQCSEQNKLVGKINDERAVHK